MKTKKQQFSLALAFLVLFSLTLTACGGSKAPSSKAMDTGYFATNESMPQELPHPEAEVQDPHHGRFHRRSLGEDYLFRQRGTGDHGI